MNKLIQINNKGVTITELIIGLGLASIVGLGVFTVLENNALTQKKFGEKMDQQIEVALADKLILRDLRAASPSLNNLRFADDNKLNFYDFDPDRSTPFYRSQKNVKRTVTLKNGGEMYFLAFDDLRGKGLFADAVTFFEVGPSPTDIYAPATLTYKGINHNNYLTAKDSSGSYLNNPLLIEFSNLNKLVLVDSSSYMPTSPLRPAVFIGKITQSGSMVDIIKIPPTSIPKDKTNADLWNYEITTPNLNKINPPDFRSFMYNLPPVGANGASVRLKPVRLYRYELTCANTKASSCILYRQDVLHGASSQKLPLMQGFNCIRFSRDDIATSVFQVASDDAGCAKISKTK